MKRKVLTILLALCVALTMMPTAAMAEPTGTAVTADYLTTNNYTLTGGADEEHAAHYYLSDNNGVVEINSTINVTGYVVLDLNGHVLKMTGTGSVIKVEKNANLIMQDSNPNAKHYFRVEQNDENYYDYKMWIWDKDVTENSSNVDAYKLVQGGVITGGQGSFLSNEEGCGGGGVLVDGGSFTLEKGNIVGCRGNGDSGGGGVYIRDGGSFYMKGGCIAGCNGCTSRGNGVYVYGNSEFHMSGGSIIDCYIQRYSCASVAVFDGVNEKGVFTMTGGEIRIDNGEYEPIAVKMHTGTMNADGGAVYGACVIYSAKLTHRTDAQSATIFYDGRNYNDALDHSDNSADKGSNDKVIDFIDNGELYAWEVVTVGNEAVKPADPEGNTCPNGYTYGWYNGDETDPYNFNSTVTKGLTLTLKQTPVNYDISYELNGGTADNPSVYTIESNEIKLNNPTKAGYTFTGWSGTGLTGENNMSVVIPKGSTENRSYTAHWQEKSSGSNTSYVQKPTVSLGTDAKAEKAADGSTVYTTAEGSIVLSRDGRTASITPADGYEVANVSVNGKDMGAVTTLTGLRTGDEIIVSFQKTEETKKAEVKAAAAKLSPIARSVKTAKGNIKVTVKFDKETESLIKEMQELGYTVKYKFYRSTKKSSGYKAMLTKSGRSYTNTNGKNGTKYYYKARVQIYDQDGKLIAQTTLKQCQYASRTWGK